MGFILQKKKEMERRRKLYRFFDWKEGIARRKRKEMEETGREAMNGTSFSEANERQLGSSEDAEKGTRRRKAVGSRER